MIPVAEATGDVQTMYEQQKGPSGEVPNYVKAFSLRPEIWTAWQQFARSIRGSMDLRRYEILTVAAAMALESSYCSLAHGRILSDQVLGAPQAEAFARDFREADLTPAEKAMVVFVQKVARQASAITQQDADELRAHGLSDVEILDVAAVCALRCFFSKLLDAVGAQPDHFYAEMAPGLRQVFTVGRAIEEAPTK
jgi:uncharacterized peroxidase-related enzyme